MFWVHCNSHAAFIHLAAALQKYQMNNLKADHESIKLFQLNLNREVYVNIYEYLSSIKSITHRFIYDFNLVGSWHPRLVKTKAGSCVERQSQN